MFRRLRQQNRAGWNIVLPLAAAACAWSFTSARAQQSADKSSVKPPAAQQVIVISDGTQVELRFAQPVVGKAARKNPFVPSGASEAQAGDSLRLVATANVRVDGQVVIAKGAVAKATITDVVPILYNQHPSEETGLFLELDWVKGVNDAEIPLRAFKKGKPDRFHAMVKSDRGGVIVHPEKILPLFAAISNHENNFPVDEKKKNWIPPGSRITAFVHGTVPLDRAEVEQAQAQLPISTSTATLTIYRTKDNRHGGVAVSCDGNPVTQIGERQYAIAELAPGAHSCQIAGEKPLAISAAAGEEYFLLLRPRLLGSWELKSVSASEGEDGIAGAEMATATQ